MKKPFQRLTRLCALPTTILYLLAGTLPTSLWADASSSKNHGKSSKKTRSSKTESPNNQLTYPPLLIGPGDLLSITVLGYDRNLGSSLTSLSTSESQSGSNNPLPNTYLVDSDGKILFPFLDDVELSGLNQIEASKLLMKKLKEKGYLKFPQVTVIIQNSNTYNVSVLGDVVHPGQFQIRGKPDILSMMAQAGGPALNPDLGGVLLTRGKQKIHIDLGKMLTDQNYHELAPTVFPGDVIYVPTNPWPTLGEIGLIASIIVSATIAADALSRR